MAFHGKRRLYAAEAEAQEKGNVENTLWFMKRLIGRKLADPEVQEEARWLSQPLTEDAEGRLQVGIDYGGEVLQLRPEEVVAMKLGQLRRTAQADMEGQICEDCVIACPGYWTDVQRRAFLQSARVANLNPVRLLNEGAAIALAYGMLRALPKDPIVVAFADIGQTSTQLTLVEFCVDTIKVLASGAEALVGGRNFTDLIVAACARQFKEKQKEDVYASPKALLKLRLACEKAKTVLSANRFTEVNCECLLNDKDLKVKVERSEFEAMCQPLLDRIGAAVGRLFQNSGIQREALHSLEIVGGGTRVPCVQHVLGEAFGKPAGRTCDGSESVAKGCALMCAVLSPSFKVKEYKMRDANPYGVTLEWTNELGEPQSAELFGKFHAYPSLKELNLKASAKVNLVLRYTSLDALPPGTTLPLGSWAVHGEELTERAKRDGVQKLKCSIRLDENGFVEVKGADLLESVEVAGDKAGKKKLKRIPLTVEGGAVNQPHADEIAVMKARDAQMTKEDELCAERENLRNDIETCVLETRGALEEGGDLAEFVSAGAREALLDSLERAEWWLEEEGQDADTPSFLAKKAELDALVGPPRELRKQAKLRADAATDMLLALSAFEKDLDGVPDEVEAPLLPQLAAAREWLADQQERQQALAPCDPPLLTAKAILDKLEAFKASTGQAIKQAKAAVSGKDTQQQQPEKETASDEPMLQLEHAGAPESPAANEPVPNAQPAAAVAPATAAAAAAPAAEASATSPASEKKAKKASKKRSKKKSAKGGAKSATTVPEPVAPPQPKPDPEALAKLAANAASAAAEARARADDLSRQAAAAVAEAEKLAKEAEDLALQATEAKARSVPVPAHLDSDLD